MLQADLNRCVARATGETVSTIARLGFIIADPTAPIDDPHSQELGPLVIDWDSMNEPWEQPDAKTQLDLLFG